MNRVKRILCVLWRHKWDWESYLYDPEAMLKCKRCKKEAATDRDLHVRPAFLDDPKVDK